MATARTARQVSQQMRAALRTLDPDISTEPTTVERKIIDTVAEVITAAELDNYLLQYQFDIDTKVGADLDKFVALFGFARQGGRRATGTVIFSRETEATQDIQIPAGTQILRPATSVTPAIIFQTTASVTLFTGTTEVEAPIEALTVGAVGNVAAGTINTISSIGSTSQVTEVTNENSTTGGTNEETDAQLIVRFKNTIFRNVAGTKDQYLALAIASRFTSKANIVGPVSNFVEFLQIAADTPSGGQTGAISQIPYSKHTYNFNYFLTNGDIIDEHFYAKGGVEYTFADTEPPSITVNNTTALPLGTVVLLEHQYCSKNSRNDPATGLLNNVDVFISGQDAVSVIESARFPTAATNFTVGNVGGWVRDIGGAPVAGGRFQELLWQPVLSLPSVITIGEENYFLNEDYFLVRDISSNKGSKIARDGIEWVSTVVDANPTADYVFEYTFDQLPMTVNELMDTHKQVTSDVLVHSATERYLIVNLVVMYTQGYARAAVDISIETALTDFFERQPFGAIIQMSDIIDIVHDVIGVDNVRIANASDGTAYGIQEVANDGETPLFAPYTQDFILPDSDLPVLQRVVTFQRSQNTWS
jgi:uncharacterized phage protein gp47/JayE